MRLRMRNSVILLLLSAASLSLAGCGIEINIDDGGGGESSRDAGTYAGRTSQGLPIAFSVTPAGGVAGVRFGWRARCEDGQVHVNTIALPGGAIQDGSFRTGGMLETGGIAHVSGHFDGGRQTGEWTTYDTSGAPYKVTTQ